MGCTTSQERPEINFSRPVIDSHYLIINQALKDIEYPENKTDWSKYDIYSVTISKELIGTRIDYIHDNNPYYLIGRSHCGEPAKFICLIKSGRKGAIQYGNGKKFITPEYAIDDASIVIWECEICGVGFSSQIPTSPLRL